VAERVYAESEEIIREAGIVDDLAISEAARAVDHQIGHGRQRQAHPAAHRAEPIDLLRRIYALYVRSGGVDEADRGVAVRPDIGGLDVRLGAEDEPRVELIIIAELSAAHDALQILSGGPRRAQGRNRYGRRAGDRNAG